MVNIRWRADGHGESEKETATLVLARDLRRRTGLLSAYVDDKESVSIC